MAVREGSKRDQYPRYTNSSIDSLWRECVIFGDEMKDLKFLKYHLDFCKKLAEAVLSFDSSIVVRIDRCQFSFDDGVGAGPFFSINLLKSKVEIAPLRLKPEELAADGVVFKDITGKVRRMGGLVRVDCVRKDQRDFDLAVELARKSFMRKEKIGPAAFFGDLKK